MTKSYIEWIPLSKRKPEPWTRVLVTVRVAYDSPKDPKSTREDWIEDTIYTATFYDDGIEENVCIGDIDKPVKYYFKLDDGFDSIYGLKEEVHDESHRPYPLGGRMRYSVTAWAKLPEPYHKRIRKDCPIKDIPAFLDQLDNDDRSHFRKEDHE